MSEPDLAVETLAAFLNDETIGGATYPGGMWPTSHHQPRQDARAILWFLRDAIDEYSDKAEALRKALGVSEDTP